jgi:hypothetical protein
MGEKLYTLSFTFEARKPRKKWLPELAKNLKKHGYKLEIVDDVLITKTKENTLKTATIIASIASLAYEGDVTFHDLGEKQGIHEYKIKLFPLKRR